VHDSRLAEVRDGLSSDGYHLPSQEAAAVASGVYSSRTASPRRACNPDQIDEEAAHRTHWDPDCSGMRSEVPYHDPVVDAASGRTVKLMVGHVQDRCSGLETAADAGWAEAQMPYQVTVLQNDHTGVAGTGCLNSQQELHRVSMCVLTDVLSQLTILPIAHPSLKCCIVSGSLWSVHVRSIRFLLLNHGGRPLCDMLGI
jgi:hypothetical protein